MRFRVRFRVKFRMRLRVRFHGRSRELACSWVGIRFEERFSVRLTFGFRNIVRVRVRFRVSLSLQVRVRLRVRFFG